MFHYFKKVSDADAGAVLADSLGKQRTLVLLLISPEADAASVLKLPEVRAQMNAVSGASVDVIWFDSPEDSNEPDDATPFESLVQALYRQYPQAAESRWTVPAVLVLRPEPAALWSIDRIDERQPTDLQQLVMKVIYAARENDPTRAMKLLGKSHEFRSLVDNNPKLVRALIDAVVKWVRGAL